MGTATVLQHDPTKNPEKQAQEATPVRIAFPRLSREHTEPAFDKAQQLDGSTHDVGPFDVPAYGYIRHLYLLVQATNGAGGAANVAAAADAPWSVIQQISLEDVNGQPIVGPFSGYDLYLANKWGGYWFNPDPSVGPDFGAVATGAGATGNFSFGLRLPVEFNRREALGALPNQSTAQQFKVKLIVNNSAALYTTAPATTLPTVRFRGVLEAWSQPADPMQQPPAVGTTGFWTKASPLVAAGSQTTKLPRVGNKIRNLIFVARDNTGARSDAMLPDPFEIDLDSKRVETVIRILQKRRMAERFGFPAASLDAGVLVFDFMHDFDGHPGSGDLRDLWLETLQGSRLEVLGVWGSAGTLDVITNDVVPAKGMVL